MPDGEGTFKIPCKQEKNADGLLAFLSVESSVVTQLNLNGVVLDQYHFDRMILHDVAVTHDRLRMLCVGTLTSSHEGLLPSKSRAEKQIIGTHPVTLSLTYIP